MVEHKFSSEDISIKLLPKDKAELLEDFFYEDEHLRISALKGFVFDGASKPKFFWRIVGHPFSHRHIRQAVIHDILYATEYFDREKSDLLFKEMLDIEDIVDVPEWEELAMYKAVRLGGGDAWDEHTEESIMNALKYIKVEKIK